MLPTQLQLLLTADSLSAMLPKLAAVAWSQLHLLSCHQIGSSFLSAAALPAAASPMNTSRASSALVSGTLHSSIPVNLDAFSPMAAPVASKNVAAADKDAMATNTQPKRASTWLEP